MQYLSLSRLQHESLDVLKLSIIRLNKCIDNDWIIWSICVRMYSIVAAAYIIATRHALHVYSIEMLVRLLLLPYTPYSNAEAECSFSCLWHVKHIWENPFRTFPSEGEGLPQWGHMGTWGSGSKLIRTSPQLKTSLIKTYRPIWHPYPIYFWNAVWVGDHYGKSRLKQWSDETLWWILLIKTMFFIKTHFWYK